MTAWQFYVFRLLSQSPLKSAPDGCPVYTVGGQCLSSSVSKIRTSATVDRLLFLYCFFSVPTSATILIPVILNWAKLSGVQYSW